MEKYTFNYKKLENRTLKRNKDMKIENPLLPAQLTPLPVKPLLQAHVKPPFVLVQAAFA